MVNVSVGVSVKFVTVTNNTGKATFKPELNSKPRKDGLFGIMISITKNRQIKRINTGVFIKKTDLNADKREIRKSNKDYQLINNFIQKKINETSIENINADVNKKELTIGSLQRKMKNEAGGGDFIKFANELTQKKQNSVTIRVY